MNEMMGKAKRLLMIVFLIASHFCMGQQILLIENRHSFKNYKYYTGENIRLKIASESRIVDGAITCMTATSVCIGSWEEVEFDDIEVIYRDRLMVKIVRAALLTAGIAYFSLDTFNRLINNQAPVVLMETLGISAGMVGMNFLLIPVTKKRIRTKNWRISMLDFDHFGLPSATVP